MKSWKVAMNEILKDRTVKRLDPALIKEINARLAGECKPANYELKRWQIDIMNCGSTDF